jgi:hypothetical protein
LCRLLQLKSSWEFSGVLVQLGWRLFAVLLSGAQQTYKSSFWVLNPVRAEKHGAFRSDPTGGLALRGREGGKSEPGLDEAERTAFVGSLILPQLDKVRKKWEKNPRTFCRTDSYMLQIRMFVR